MLTNTFIYILGIGAITEQRLWESGIRDWGSIKTGLPIPVSGGRRHFLLRDIEESRIVPHIDRPDVGNKNQSLPISAQTNFSVSNFQVPSLASISIRH
jgi:hypothetical protein